MERSSALTSESWLSSAEDAARAASRFWRRASWERRRASSSALDLVRGGVVGLCCVGMVLGLPRTVSTRTLNFLNVD